MYCFLLISIIISLYMSICFFFILARISQESSVKSLFQAAQPSLSAKQLLKSSGDSKEKDSKSGKKDKDKEKEKPMASDDSEAGCEGSSKSEFSKLHF